MATEWICDGCGRRESGVASGVVKEWSKPYRWFTRADDDGIQDACSRDCIDRIGIKSGKTRAIFPV